jgi:hypothetical protein
MSEFGTLTPRMAAYRERMLSTLPRWARSGRCWPPSRRAHRPIPSPAQSRMLETVLAA